ncbi:MAG: hypothetical protein U5L04_13990 [Trueperaceae bacterium]|nr:hypothetical protein [Trueperaceae bacterium]
MKRIALLVLPAAMLLLSSCATVVTGASPTNFTANSTPQGATVVAVALQGSERLSTTTPGTLSLSKGSDYELTFSLEGYESEIIVVRRSINGWFWGNIIIGGIPGWIIDYATNSMWKHNMTIANVDFTNPTAMEDGSVIAEATLQIYDDEGNPYLARVPITFYPKS